VPIKSSGKKRSASHKKTRVHNSFLHRTDDGQASLIKAFESGKGLDKDRCAVTKDLHLRSVDKL